MSAEIIIVENDSSKGNHPSLATRAQHHEAPCSHSSWDHRLGRWFGLVKFVWRIVISEETLAETEIPGGGGRMRLYMAQRCHHQNYPCIIKMGSEESHFNVSAFVRGKVTKTASINHNFLQREESRSRIEPRPFCLPASPLGQTGPPMRSLSRDSELRTYPLHECLWAGAVFDVAARKILITIKV